MEYPLLLWKIYMHYWVYKWTPVKKEKIVTLRNISMFIKFLVAFEAIVQQWSKLLLSS